MGLLDKLPLATLISISSIVLVIIAYINKDISVQDAFIALGVSNAGAGVIGHARNGAGKGVRGDL